MDHPSGDGSHGRVATEDHRGKGRSAGKGNFQRDAGKPDREESNHPAAAKALVVSATSEKEDTYRDQSIHTAYEFEHSGNALAPAPDGHNSTDSPSGQPADCGISLFHILYIPGTLY